MDTSKFLGKLAKEIKFNSDFLISDRVWAVTKEGDLVKGTITKIVYEPFRYGIEEAHNLNLLKIKKIRKVVIVKIGQTEIEIEQFFTDFGKENRELFLTKIDEELPGAIFKTLTEADDYIKEQEKFKADIINAELAEDLEYEDEEDQEDDDETV